MPHCIYMHTHYTGRYVGQTKHVEDPNIRWLNGYGYKGQDFYEVARTEFDLMDHDILCVVETKKEADLMESFFILTYNCCKSGGGWNRSYGMGIRYAITVEELQKAGYDPDEKGVYNKYVDEHPKLWDKIRLRLLYLAKFDIEPEL